MNQFGMKKHHLKVLWTAVLVTLFCLEIHAQSGSVTGRISDEKGELLIGVSVQEKGTGNGTITDINGQHTLKLTSSNPTLVISYVGYKPQEKH